MRGSRVELVGGVGRMHWERGREKGRKDGGGGGDCV